MTPADIIMDSDLVTAVALLMTLVISGLLFFIWRRKRRNRDRRWLVLDGSNIIHWKKGEPQIETLIQVVHHLRTKGFNLGVVFDANAGYKIDGRYLHHGDFAGLLLLPERQVMVVPKGMPADPTILSAARDFGAQIVTNDRYRDWSDEFPEVLEPGHLIRGHFKSDALHMALPSTLEQGTTQKSTSSKNPR